MNQTYDERHRRLRVPAAAALAFFLWGTGLPFSAAEAAEDGVTKIRGLFASGRGKDGNDRVVDSSANDIGIDIEQTRSVDSPRFIDGEGLFAYLNGHRNTNRYDVSKNSPWQIAGRKGSGWVNKARGGRHHGWGHSPTLDQMQGFVTTLESRGLAGEGAPDDDDILIFVFAGHGNKSGADGDGDEPQGVDRRSRQGRDEARPKTVGATGCEKAECDESIVTGNGFGDNVLDDDLLSIFEDFPGRKVMIFGSCFSGGLADGARDLRAADTIVMMACDTNEYAYGTNLSFAHNQGQKTWHSLFLGSLLAGLEAVDPFEKGEQRWNARPSLAKPGRLELRAERRDGCAVNGVVDRDRPELAAKADANWDCAITVEEWFDYAKKSTISAVEAVRGEATNIPKFVTQRPEMVDPGGLAENLVIYRYREPWPEKHKARKGKPEGVGHCGGCGLGDREPAQDLRAHYAGEAADGPAWSDVRCAEIDVVRSASWSDDRTLSMSMELYEPVPSEPEALFASWHFVLDLDGRPSTGHAGGERPVGVFPDLGVDLWADVIWDGHEFRSYLFLGPTGIEHLIDTPGLLEVRGSDDRRKVHFEIPVEPLEEIFSDLYDAPFAIDREEIEWVAVTNHVDDFGDLEDPPSDFFPDWLYLPEGACERSAREGTAMCLQDGRFKVEVEWKDYQGTTGSGQVVPFGSDDSGLMWFFDSDNWEMLVKVLDGCRINERYWVFAAANTDVEYTLRVTDGETGDVREYFNPLGGAAAAITDTDAFASCSAEGKSSRSASPAWMKGFLSGTPPSPQVPAVDGPADSLGTQEGCVPGPTSLCLNEGRFLVEVEWLDFKGQIGPGRAVIGGSDDSGLFWFFDAENWEMLVKVLDGCVINNRFWVYAAATTDVGYTLKVTDTQTGAVQEYFNPLGSAADAITDTDAFATCG